MDMQFYDDGQHDLIPRPPEAVRIEEIEIAVYPDRRRVFLHVRVTPFQVRPNLLVAVRSAAGQLASELSIIETMHHDMEFTLHLRGLDDTTGDYTLTADVYYETRNPPVDRRIEAFTVPALTDEA